MHCIYYNYGNNYNVHLYLTIINSTASSYSKINTGASALIPLLQDMNCNSKKYALHSTGAYISYQGTAYPIIGCYVSSDSLVIMYINDGIVSMTISDIDSVAPSECDSNDLYDVVISLSTGKYVSG